MVQTAVREQYLAMEALLHLDKWILIFTRVLLAVVPKADRATRTRTRTLWGELCLDAVACEGCRLIQPTRMLCLEGLF